MTILETTRRPVGEPNYAVLRHERLHHVTQLTDVRRHNNREMDVPNVDRSAPEPTLVWGDGDVRRAVTSRIASLGIKPRKGAVIALELVMSTSREFWEDMPSADRPRELRLWIGRCMAYARARFGRHALIAGILHDDETTPHLHVVVVPARLKVDGRRRDAVERYTLTARDVVGGRGDMRHHQTVYARAMARFGLVRGEEGSKARHIPNRDYEQILSDSVEAANAREKAALLALQAANDREAEADRRITAVSDLEVDLAKRESDLREREATAVVTSAERAAHDARVAALSEDEAAMAVRRQKADDWSASVRKRADDLKASAAAVAAREEAIAQDQAQVARSMDALAELRVSWKLATRALTYLGRNGNPEVRDAIRALVQMDATADAVVAEVPGFGAGLGAAERRRAGAALN